ncbi:sensor histidine kinase KdpD [Nocardioides sp.]|uniref:sensor histidine kinase n=1 Tax=Nocardioides sp. TaxID=35761 RepID=UPI00262F4EAF|nr:HAMP domain-containing sensor histidine kinase [Nocardioides sp.]
MRGGAPPVVRRSPRRQALLTLLVATPVLALLAVAVLALVTDWRRGAFEESAVAEARSVLVTAPDGLSGSGAEALARALRRPGDLEVVIVRRAEVEGSDDGLGLGDVPDELQRAVLATAPDGEAVSATRTTIDGQDFLVAGGTVSEPGTGERAQAYLFFSERPVARGVLRSGVLVGAIAVALLALLTASGWLLTRRRLEAVAVARERELAFAAHLAHEIRTPVGAMVTASSLVDDATLAAAPEDVRAPMRLIRDQAGRLGRVVEDLLEVSRLQTGQVQVRPEQVAVRELLGRVRRDFDWETVRVVVHGEPVVLMDPQSLARIVVNLVSNAVRHAGTHVALTARREGSEVLVEVQDQGPGLPPAVLHDLARRPTDPPAGRGLGLRVARAHAELLGTRLEVDTGPRGTTVGLRLPAT